MPAGLVKHLINCLKPVVVVVRIGYGAFFPGVRLVKYEGNFAPVSLIPGQTEYISSVVHVHNKYPVESVKIIRERRRYDGGSINRVAECIVGDQYGCVKMMAFDEQLDIVKEGHAITIRNAHANVVKEHVRLEVDRWAKVEASKESVSTKVNTSKNYSDIEYELVTK